MAATGMSTTRRPLRIGWCVRSGNKEHLRSAFRLSSMLWGGRYNPIIPVDKEGEADQLARLFLVDALYPVDVDDSAITSFVESRRHIAWAKYWPPLIHTPKELGQPYPYFGAVDVLSAFRWARGEMDKHPLVRLGCIPTWSDDDPLSDWLLATFGAYGSDEIGSLFEESYRAAFDAKQRRELTHDEFIPPDMRKKLSPLRLTTVKLSASRGGFGEYGILLGDVSSTEDLTELWNLNAAGRPFLMYDPNHAGRLAQIAQREIDRIQERYEKTPEDDWKRRLTIRSRDGRDLPAELTTSLRRSVGHLDQDQWNGLNVKPVVVSTDHRTVVADVSEGSDGRRPRLTWQSDDSDIGEIDEHLRQLYVTTIKAYTYAHEHPNYTFFAPNIPEMNEYVSRAMVVDPDHARVGPDGLGVVTEVGRSWQTLYGLAVDDYFNALFERVGFAAKPSRAGLVGRRLIRQMGGLSGCRVFKIAGVRRLIAKYRADQPFTYNEFCGVLGPDFDAYKDSFLIVRRSGSELSMDDVFQSLIGKDVFRAGLVFECPSCQLDFWQSLDDARTSVECQYCGSTFNAALQLRQRRGGASTWHYRRSGLFGKDDNQAGGIPVALVLQQLAQGARGSEGDSLYSTATDLTPMAGGASCETDFVFLSHDFDGTPELVIGEAKTKGDIDENDVANLARVAAAFGGMNIHVYRLFAKAGELSTEEIERCLEKPNTWPVRSFLWSRMELEADGLYRVYEDLPDGIKHPVGLDRIAYASEVYYRREAKRAREVEAAQQKEDGQE